MKRRITILMTAFLLMFSYAGLAQVVSGTTYSTPSVENLPTGWSGEDGGGTTYIKLIDAAYYIQTASFEQNGFTSITIKARKFGGPTAEQAQISVSWYDSADVETVLGTIDPTSTTLTNYTINSFATTENGTGYIKIQNKGASSSKGSGVSEVTITYVEPGGTQPTTYTVTYYANVTGTAPVVDTYVEGADVTLRPANTFTNEGYTFSEWNTDANGDGDAYDAGDVIEDIQDNIELYAIWTENPVSDEQWVLTNLADLTANDVFVIVGNNGSTYAMSNNNGTSNPPAAVAVTVENEAITSTVAETIQWNISGNANDGYIFYPNGSITTWLYCYNNNNGLRVGTGNDKTFVMNSNYLYNSGQGRYIGIYQSSNWRSYTSINTNIQGQTFAFYKKVTGGVLPPSISAENVEIAYDATQGSFTFTLNNPVEGGQLDITEDVDWIDEATINTTATGYSVTFITTMNEAGTPREGVITISYTYNTDQTVTKNVTVTQAANPNVVNNISDITEINTQYAVKGMVVATSNKGFIICDGTGFVYTYLNAAPTQQVGDFVQITGTTGSYGHVIQFTNNATIAEAEEFIFDWPDYTVITEVPDYTEGYHLSDYFQFEGALTKSGSNYLVAVGEGQIRISYPTTEQAADLETLLNKTVRIHGFFTGYSGTGSNAVFTAMMESYEEVTSTDPSITIATYTLNVDAEEHEGTINVTYANVDIEMAEVMLCNAEGEPATYDWIQSTLDDNHNIGYNISANEGEARTAYLKVCIYEVYPDVISFSSDIVTVNQAAYVAPALDFAELPFEFNGGRADIEDTDGLTQEGLGSDYNATTNPTTKLKFDGTGDWMLLHFNEAPGTLIFDIKGNGFNGGTFTVQTSEDGETYEDLVAYTELGDVDTKTFNNLGEDVRYIKWIYTEKATGNVGLGNIYLYELGGGPVPVASIMVEFDEIEVTATGEEDYAAITYENLEITQASDFDIQFYDAAGAPLNEQPDWIAAEVTTQIGEEGYFVYYVIEDNEGEARTAYFKVYALDANSELVYSNLVTVSQAAYVPPFTGATYSLATTIESGRHYIIVGLDGEDAYAMGQQNNNNRAAVAIDIVDGVAQVNSDEVYEFVINMVDIYDGIVDDTISSSGSGGFGQTWLEVDYLYTIYDVVNTGYLYAASNSSNYLRTETHLDAYDNGKWTIWIDNNGVATVKACGSNSRNLMRYNSGSDIFSCYGSGQQDIYLYVKDEDVPQYDFYKDIAGYGDSDGGYYLVATPTNDDIDPANVGMIDGNYDLYAFDFAYNGEEWRNYKAQSFNLSNGQGYLYASQDNVTLHFQGAPNPELTQSINLQYETGSNAAFNGWNLVGNPLNTVAYIGRSFYVMNVDGTELELAQRDNINPMEGIFVKAESENDAVSFIKWVFPGSGLKLDLSVSNGNGDKDFARISFGEGQDLEKLMFNPNHTKLYFVQGENNYAEVHSAYESEMPVYFKAENNGTYTFSVNAENVEVEYLHLIDNMTGVDVDLLANPDYTFEANTTDYASRFRLVFSITSDVNENVDGESAFAYNNGSSWMVNNMGEATLQVVDVMGRIVSSQTINGNAEVNINETAGVYMLRLVNGNSVKVQKVVVR